LDGLALGVLEGVADLTRLDVVEHPPKDVFGDGDFL